MSRLSRLCKHMMIYYKSDAHQIQHLIKVHSFAKLIAEEEHLEGDALYALEAAAYVHDIGIKPALEKYGMDAGPLQEKEGEKPAREMLTTLGFKKEIIDRVVYLVGHHHTYTGIDGLDYQILIEADFLVNMHEGNYSDEAIRTAIHKYFRTDAGRFMAFEMYLPDEMKEENWAENNITELDDWIESQGIYIRQ